MSKRRLIGVAILSVFALAGSPAIYWFFSTQHRYDVLMTKMQADLDSDMRHRVSSNDRYVYENRYFKEICALGRPVVPLAISDLKEEKRERYSAALLRTLLPEINTKLAKKDPDFSIYSDRERDMWLIWWREEGSKQEW